jgi:hypothetical protein
MMMMMGGLVFFGRSILMRMLRVIQWYRSARGLFDRGVVEYRRRSTTTKVVVVMMITIAVPSLLLFGLSGLEPDSTRTRRDVFQTVLWFLSHGGDGW